ncbi:MAG: Spy/CpxP family protein refolding chaperone [Burkholderiales bacterium]|nr:Spy/CpxP family protein refolding chaperone [Burkholderiales bacterium]
MKRSIAAAAGPRAAAPIHPFHPWRLLLATMLLALAAGLSLPAFAEAGPGRSGGPGMMLLSPRALDRVDATPAQREQIRQILQAARKDLQPLREQGRSLREQGLALFTQPTIDAAAAEALRQQELTLHDQASRRMLQAMVDAGNVLTTAQRQRLAAQLQQRAALMHKQRAERAALDGGRP